MKERPKCAQCGKDAIGVQSFGCRISFACDEHAHSILRALGPGRNYSTGDCTFERFDMSGTVPGDERGLPPDCGRAEPDDAGIRNRDKDTGKARAR